MLLQLNMNSAPFTSMNIYLTVSSLTKKFFKSNGSLLVLGFGVQYSKSIID
jgi:hypothetical protein